MLKDYLAKRNVVKIASGAGTEDAEYIYKLVRIYTIAGVPYFDISAHPESVIAARKAIKDSGVQNEVYINCSMGIPGDPHADKAKIDPVKCRNCDICYKACKNEAILKDYTYFINYKRCIGCGYCAKKCPNKAITMYSASRPVEDIVPELIPHGVDSLELHMAGDIEYGMMQWKKLEENFKGILSVHINRTVCSDQMLTKMLDEIIYSREPYTTTIQADGLSMSGDDGSEITLQALAIAQIVDMQKYPAYLISSGGTNSKTAGYMKDFKINYDGIAYGTYARNLVKKYLHSPDFFEHPRLVNEAVSLIRKYIFGEVSIV
jgi:Fe-S-cluster-containing hydrogenase component 2